jgi:hypothetical protein
LNNYANELNDMEASAKLIPTWMLTAISRIMEAEMNEREAVTKGLTGSLTAKGDESIVDPSGTAKPHLTLVKTGEMK